MFQVSRVEIDGFWGKYKASTDFYPDVNIFIGKNGTGKTTFINLLQSVLRADLKMLMSLEFSKITVKLKDETKTRTISVIKEDHSDLPFEASVLVFRVGNKPYRFTLFRDSEPNRLLRQRSRINEEYEDLRMQINEIINIASLSVHRSTYDTIYEDEYPSKRSRTIQSPIDQRLESLVQKLTSYQLTLAESASRVSADFQKEVLLSMLYNSNFDRFDVQDASNVELSKEKEELLKAYKDLGIFDRSTSKRIDNHISILNKSLISLKNDNDAYNVDDVMPLPLLKRTQHIITLSRKAENQRQEVFKPINQFVQTVKEFISDKDFSIASNGDITITKDGKNILTADLSSGEKQLLILLIETLLQKREFFIFIADEPELSLHIEWQSKVIESIKRLNYQSQVIVATHSPEIAGGWKDRIIDMEDVING